MRPSVIVLILFLSTSAFGSSGSVSAGAAEPLLEVRVAGEAYGNSLLIKAILGNGVTRAVRIYSEPSRTLLAAYINADIPEPVNTAWMETAMADEDRANRDFPLARFPFHRGAEAVVTTSAAPKSDSYLKVWIYGSWMDSDGIVREQEYPISVATNLSSFSFTFNRRLALESESSRFADIIERRDRRFRSRKITTFDTVCCGQDTDCGGRACIDDCPQQTYCCTSATVQGCDWCASNMATCGFPCTPSC